MVRRHLERKFPMKCPGCARRYANLKDYISHTAHIAPPVSYDAALGKLRPWRPLGTRSFARCRCGHTLSLDSRGMGLWTMWRFLAWLPGEMNRTGKSASAVLVDLRREIDRATMAGGPL